MLMSVIVYMYTVIAFNFFRKFYSKEEEGEIEENCQDLFTVNISKDLID
jgi:ryanodine receptor 2